MTGRVLLLLDGCPIHERRVGRMPMISTCHGTSYGVRLGQKGTRCRPLVRCPSPVSVREGTLEVEGFGDHRTEGARLCPKSSSSRSGSAGRRYAWSPRWRWFVHRQWPMDVGGLVYRRATVVAVALHIGQSVSILSTKMSCSRRWLGTKRPYRTRATGQPIIDKYVSVCV